MSLAVGRPAASSLGREEQAESLATTGRGEPVPGLEQLGLCFDKYLSLIFEHHQCQPGVQLRVVPAPPDRRAVLVVLHQVVVGIAGEGQRVSPERVDRG